MFIFRAATWIFSGGLFVQQRYFLKCDGRAKLAGRAMSSPLSFMHYVCYIMSVHLCIEKSELSQLAHHLFVHNDCWQSSHVSLSTAQKSALLRLLHSWYMQLFIYVSLWPHIPFDDGQGCWWTGNLLLLMPCTPRIPSSVGFTGIAYHFQFKIARQQWHKRCHIPRRCSVYFVVWHRPDLLRSTIYRNCEEVTRKSSMAK